MAADCAPPLGDAAPDQGVAKPGCQGAGAGPSGPAPAKCYPALPIAARMAERAPAMSRAASA